MAAPFIYKIQLYTLSTNFDKLPVFSKQITGKFSKNLENKSPQFRNLVEREFKNKSGRNSEFMLIKKGFIEINFQFFFKFSMAKKAYFAERNKLFFRVTYIWYK